MRVRRSRDVTHFERLYAANPDPWDFAGSAYEQQKYALTLEALGTRRFASAFEAGCSIGVLTEKLAPRCASLLAADIAPAAVRAARRRVPGLAQVRVEQLHLPAQWPPGRFDLILFSEILYFLQADDIHAMARLSCGALQAGGLILLVNYTGPTDDPCSGDEAADIFIAAIGLERLLHRRHVSFRLDLLGSAPER